MNMGWLYAVWAFFSLFSLASMLWLGWMVTYRPLALGRMLEPQGFDRRDSMRVTVAGWASFLGLATVLYLGMHAAMGWIPAAWGFVLSSSDGGTYVTVRGFVAAMLSLCATLGIFGAACNLADLRIKRAREIHTN